MIVPVMRRLRREWHLIRRRWGAGIERPARLVVTKATWLHDARSPVTLMIDDLTNAWHSRRAGGHWDSGGDWGGGRDAQGSALRLLEDGLLADYPEARVTFFTVAGPIASYTSHEPFSYAEALDVDEESRRFFRRLAADPRFELAYHGYNHGTPGAQTELFVQEWRGFASPEAALAQTARGLETFARAIGTVPLGGKYGGWDYNGHADDVVDQCGFLWWCRDWMPRDVSGRIADEYYEPQFFGRQLVVALPSTVHGHFWDGRQVDRLLARRQVIAIEEHISGVRPDGLVQTPNIVDDMPDLRRLYGYLRGKRVWHATCSQIATYVIARERSLVYDVTKDGFSLQYDGRAAAPVLTLRIDSAAICSDAQPLIEVVTPAGAVTPLEACRFDRKRFRHLVTVPVQQGRYRVRARAEGPASVAAGRGGRSLCAV